MQQEASAEILRAPATPSGDAAAPVFDTILESCQRLFNPYDAAVYLVEGDRVRGVARRGPGVGDWGADTMLLEGSSTGAAIAQRRPVHFPDLADKADLPEDKRAQVVKEAIPPEDALRSDYLRISRCRVPRRHAPPKKPFTETEIESHSGAVLIRPLSPSRTRGCSTRCESRTRDLGEALEQQTATADVSEGNQPLGVRSRCCFDADARTLRRGTVRGRPVRIVYPGGRLPGLSRLHDDQQRTGRIRPAGADSGA